jgi:hypothetical protein
MPLAAGLEPAPAAAVEGAWFAVEPGRGAGLGRLIASYGSFDLIESSASSDALKLASGGAFPADYLKRIGFLQGAFDPLESVPEVPAEYRSAPVTSGLPSLHLIQFAGPVKQEWKDALAARAQILAYIPHSAYVVRAAPEEIASASVLPSVRWSGSYQPWYKVEPALLHETATESEARVLVDLHLFSGPGDIREATGLFRSVERVERSEANLIAIGRIPRDSLPALARLDAVAWVQRYSDPEFINGEAQWVVQSGTNGQRPVWAKGLHGEGQVVGYADTGLDYDHIFFRDPTNPIGPNHRKVIGYKKWASNDGDTNGHGTHVAGSIAGNDKPLSGTSVNVGQGYEAKLFVDDVSNSGGDWSAPADLNSLYAESFNASARLHSNSWGWPTEHTYTKAASNTDQFMWDHKDEYLIVYAVGNERGSGANSLRSPGLSKNIVSVGATENGANANDMASFSSVGPTNPDGRLKPTICAPGSGIRSADSDGNLGTNNAGEVQMSGTSMATPTTTGVLSTIRQYFTEGWYPSGAKSAADAFVPTPALMKAVLMAGAKEITGAGSDYNTENVYPNNSQGWGIINSDNSLYFQGDSNRLAVWEEKTGINTGETRTYTFDVSSDTQMLRVILVWTDYWGAVNANPAIVNDLDLEVTDPTGTKYFGNVFQGKNPGHSVTGGSPDRKNVEEGVLIPNAGLGLKTGKWSMLVRAQNAPQGPQPFAIAVTGDVRGGGSGSSLSRIDVTPPTATITADQTQQFTAQAFDLNGNATNATFTWNSTGGSVDSTGLYTPGPVGTFQVRASAGGKVGTANVTVTPGALVSVLVSPSASNVSAGGTAVFGAQGVDGKGNKFLINVNWSSSIGSIDQSGTFTAPTTLGSGTVTATEKNTSRQGTATVNVVAGPVARMDVTPQGQTIPADQTLQFTAQGYDQYNNPTQANPAWSVTSGAMSATGLFTPDKAGAQTVTARDGAVSATAPVTVLPGKVFTIKVEPPQSSITADDTLKLAAKGFDSKGNEVQITPSWTTTLGTIAPDGTYTPDKAGTAVVTASSSGLAGTASVEVRPGRLASLEVAPATAEISADQKLPLEAIGRDAKGNQVSIGGTVQWSVQDGRISGTGAKVTYEPAKAGVWEVTAASGSANGKAVITVKPGRLAEVRVDPEAATVMQGEQAKFSALALDVNGNEIADALVDWEVSDRLGTFEADGTFTATKVGDGKVIARVTKGTDTINGQALITVTSVPPLRALQNLFGGETNFWIVMLLLIALIVAGAVGAAVSRRRRRQREEALNAFYSQAPQGPAGPPPPPSGPPPPYMPPPGAPPPNAVPAEPPPAGAEPPLPKPPEY